MKSISALLILFVFSITTFAQSKKEWQEYGDAAFKKEDYRSAAAFYLNAIDKKTKSKGIAYPYETKTYISSSKKNNENDTTITLSNTTPTDVPDLNLQYVTHQIAECYRLNRDYANALIWYKKSMDYHPVEYPYEGYLYGDALMKLGQYPESKIEFKKVMDIALLKNDSTILKMARVKMAGCDLAINTTIKKQIVVTELDSLFNSGTSSFAINYYGDQNTIQYTAAREGTSISNSPTQNAGFVCDIYTLQKKGNVWGNLKKMESSVNTNVNEGAGFLTPDSSRFFFTRWAVNNKSECAIYASKLINNKWLAAEKMNENVNLKGYKSMQPALTADGKTLYFSSNRPGGFGKMDLWYVTLNEEGEITGPPVNMGPLINTPEDEVTPFFHNSTKSLFFSSDGHPGFGGLDIFNSSFHEDYFWQKPRNLGIPVNSSKDDAYYILEPKQQHGFFTSDRKDCSNCESGACYKVYSVYKEPNVYDITGTAYNAENNQAIANALITFKDIRNDKEEFFIFTDAEGKYFTQIEEGTELYIKTQKNKYFGDATTVSTTGLTESKHFKKDFFLSVIPQGEIVIPGIEYDYDQATLRPESKKILNDLAEFLNLNNNLSVEISSHTDTRGSDEYNMRLSQERAKSVVNYLIEKSIAANRLKAQGYGETKPLIVNAKTEEEYQKNRRTAFRPFKEGKIRAK